MGAWERLAETAASELQGIIAAVTFAERKARQIPAALREIAARRGRLDLEFLARWPVDGGAGLAGEPDRRRPQDQHGGCLA